MGLTRRSFIAGVACTASVVCVTGCGRLDEDQAESWTATQDDSLTVLTAQVSGGAVVAMPGEAWAPRDGFIQLQLAGGSIPGAQIESVARDGSTLTVRLKSQDGPQTMDLVLTEFRLEGGDVSAVETVKVDHGNGDVRELERARQ